MSDVMEYKCPACGGAMEFDSKTQQLKCPYCDTQISVEEWERQNAKDQGTAQWTSTGNETLVPGGNPGYEGLCVSVLRW